MKAMMVALILCLAALAPAEADAQFDNDRALANYRAVMRGQKQFNALSLAEQREVAEIDRLARGQPADTRSAYERCREAQIGKDREPTELEDKAVDLKCSQR